tara:strand:+ start:7676 stop:7957 length:282 start_codon:yes stop_codon:yes gene_type:complete
VGIDVNPPTLPPATNNINCEMLKVLNPTRKAPTTPMEVSFYRPHIFTLFLNDSSYTPRFRIMGGYKFLLRTEVLVAEIVTLFCLSSFDKPLNK